MAQSHFQPTAGNQVAGTIYRTAIPGLWYIASQQYIDERGYFAEAAVIDDINGVCGFTFQPRQLNVAYSKTNVARGFHIEAWNKLITVVQGTAFCAVADVRPESPAYKQVETFILGAEAGNLNGCLFISKGLANSYCVTSGPVSYIYVVDALYRDRDKANDHSISLFDPTLNVIWPIPQEQMVISQRDLDGKTL